MVQTTEIMKPDVVCTIGDNVQNLTKSIKKLRRKLADDEAFHDHHGEKIRLTRKRAQGQPLRWTRFQVKASDNQTTLAIRDDKCYGVGFENQSGVWYDLGHRRERDDHQLPQEYNKELPPDFNSVLLGWGLSYKDILGVSRWEEVPDKLDSAGLGKKSFAEKAVRTLWRYPDVDEEDDLMMNPRVALAGLILMVCESARFGPVLKYFQDNWDNDTETGGFSGEQMKYIRSWGKISRALLLWKDDGKWPRNGQTPVLDRRGIKEQQRALSAVRLVYSDARTLKVSSLCFPLFHN